MRTLRKSEIRRVRGGVDCGVANALKHVIKKKATKKKAKGKAVATLRGLVEKLCSDT